jgi:hypothetical protein
METTTQIARINDEATTDRGFSIDTSFVLFFLAIEFGQSFAGFSFESIFLVITLLTVAVAPYFAQSGEKPEFGIWLIGRAAILVFALVLGVIFKQSLGVVFPAEFRFIPMTLLILSAILSCYIQFDSFLRLRLAK